MNKFRLLFTLLVYFSLCILQPVATSAQNTIMNIHNIPACKKDPAKRFEFIQNNYFGLNVENYSGDFIGRPFSKRAPWMPIGGGYRITVAGRIQNYYISTEHNHDDDPANDQDEFDWNIDLNPGHSFYHGDVIPGSSHTINEQESSTMECEVTPAVGLRDNIWFPKNPGNFLFKGKDICLYGPWVSDWGNGDQHEIHPVEAIWWPSTVGNDMDIMMILIQDATRLRFDEYSDYQFDVNNDYIDDSLPGWKPWVEFPMKETIKIPFQYDFHSGSHLVVDIEQVLEKNVITVLYPELRDADDGTNHKLQISSQGAVTSIYQPPVTVAEVNETGDAGNYLGVQFSDLCRTASGSITGYIKIVTAIGQPFAHEFGYQVLRIKKRFVTDVVNSPLNH
jgi:hypothetical protein